MDNKLKIVFLLASYVADLVSSGQENGIPFEPINKADDVDPIRNSDQQEVDRDATKAHEDTNRLNERDACPNTYLPEGSDQEKMHVEIDPKTTEPTGSFCGCNENEFLEALPTDFNKPGSRICLPCPEGQYMPKHAHKERGCQKRNTSPPTPNGNSQGGTRNDISLSGNTTAMPPGVTISPSTTKPTVHFNPLTNFLPSVAEPPNDLHQNGKDESDQSQTVIIVLVVVGILVVVVLVLVLLLLKQHETFPFRKPMVPNSDDAENGATGNVQGAQHRDSRQDVDSGSQERGESNHTENVRQRSNDEGNSSADSLAPLRRPADFSRRERRPSWRRSLACLSELKRRTCSVSSSTSLSSNHATEDPGANQPLLVSEELPPGPSINESLQNSVAAHSSAENPSHNNDHIASSSTTAQPQKNPLQTPLNEDDIQPSSPTSDTFPNQVSTRSNSTGAPFTESSLHRADRVPDSTTSPTRASISSDGTQSTFPESSPSSPSSSGAPHSSRRQLSGNSTHGTSPSNEAAKIYCIIEFLKTALGLIIYPHDNSEFGKKYNLPPPECTGEETEAQKLAKLIENGYQQGKLLAADVLSFLEKHGLTFIYQGILKELFNKRLINA